MTSRLNILFYVLQDVQKHGKPFLPMVKRIRKASHMVATTHRDELCFEDLQESLE